MARLSTGQAFGETSRASAAQLLGGIPTDASGGVLAQGSIATPSLQPRATPVDTFQRVGAPMLGGAPKFFAPPDLPNPGQDLANLSRALGGFSTTLQSFGETWLANKQEQDKREEQATGAFVGQASRFGPARGIADLAANLEKAAALGNPDAARMLQVVREKQNNSVGKYWLQRSIEQNAIQGAALSLPDRIASTSMIKVDGKDVELSTLSSDDPRYLAYRDEQLFGGAQMSPQGYAKNQGIIVQAQLQADQAQRKRYNANMAAMAASQVAVNRQSIAQDYVSTRRKDVAYSESYAVRAVQQEIDGIRLLGLAEESKTKLVNDYLESFASDVVLAARSQGLNVSDANKVLRPVLQSIMTGPVDQRVKADNKPNEALRLYNTLGGESYLDQIVAKANASQIQNNTQQAQMAGIQQQQSIDNWLATTLPEGRRSDPAAIRAAFQAKREQMSAEPDGVVRAAGFAQLNALENQLTETYIKPVQEQRSLWYTQQLAGTAGDEGKRNRLAAQLQADLAAGLVTSATANSIQSTLSAQGSKEVRTYDKEIEKRVNAVVKDFEEYMTSPKSYGGQAIDDFEYQSVFNARALARRRFTDATYQAIKDGKDPTEAMNKIQASDNFGLRRREEVGGTQAPMYTNGAQLMQKNTGNWSRNTIDSRSANQLRGQAKVRPLYQADAFATDVDAFLNGAPSQNFRTLLKTLGGKPSESILNQFRLHGIPVDDETRRRIQALDNQQISAAPASRRTSPQQNGALAGVQIAGRALGNLLAPPAQAADLTSMMYANPSSTRTRAQPQPQPTVTPQARVDGYMKRLAYIETRIRNIPNAEGSAGRGFFQAFPDFSAEAKAASGGIDPRDSDYGRSSRAAAAWIRVYNKKAWAAIRAGRYDEADRLLRNTWPSLPGGSQAQDDKVQKAARKYLR